MSVNIKQNNTNGENNAHLSDSGNETKTNNKFTWKMRGEGFIIGIIISIVANYIYAFLTK
ncbi:MAG: hypothetical protein WC827_01700 [Candidatus Paceibacterota bacterium]|jgi:cellobiose-specific phosphotransferase system component IIC